MVSRMTYRSIVRSIGWLPAIIESSGDGRKWGSPGGSSTSVIRPHSFHRPVFLAKHLGLIMSVMLTKESGRLWLPAPSSSSQNLSTLTSALLPGACWFFAPRRCLSPWRASFESSGSGGLWQVSLNVSRMTPAESEEA